MDYFEFLRLLASYLAVTLPKDAKLAGSSHICIGGQWQSTTHYWTRDNIFTTAINCNQQMLAEWEAHEFDRGKDMTNADSDLYGF